MTSKTETETAHISGCTVTLHCKETRRPGWEPGDIIVARDFSFVIQTPEGEKHLVCTVFATRERASEND